MPKVGTIRVTFETFPAHFELHYNQKLKFHIKGLPQRFLKVMDNEFLEFGYSTEEDAHNSLFHAVKKYRDKIKAEKKVILFKIEASPRLCMNEFDHEGSRGFSGTKKGVSKRIKSGKLGFTPDCTIGIEYNLAIEVNDGQKKYFRLKEDGITIEHERKYDDREWTSMEWTPEREAFFKNVYDQMNKLIIGLSKFFTDNDEELIKRIDSAGDQIKLLTGPSIFLK